MAIDGSLCLLEREDPQHATDPPSTSDSRVLFFATKTSKQSGNNGNEEAAADRQLII